MPATPYQKITYQFMHSKQTRMNSNHTNFCYKDKLMAAVGEYQHWWQMIESMATTLLAHFHSTSLEYVLTTTEAIRSRTVQCIEDKECHHWPLFIQQTIQTAQ